MDDVEQAHDFADPPADHGQRGPGRACGAPAFDLEEGERDGREDDVVRPARIAAPLEMIEAEIVLELAILLLDRPAAAGERDEVDQRRGRGHVEQVVHASDDPVCPLRPGWLRPMGACHSG